MASPDSQTSGKKSVTASLGKDASAGVVLGVESVPDGLAGGLLAGVNPVFGLYGYMVGTLAGGLTTSSAFMAVQATGAMAVVVSDVDAVQAGAPDADTALWTLAVMTGIIMLVLGLFKLGSLVRWVPNSVLAGFINAVAINIILGQFADFTGYTDAEGANKVVKAIDTLFNVSAFDWATVAVGTATIVLIVLLERTRLGALGMVVAILLTSAAVPLFGLDSVQRLEDVADIPGSLPTPSLPALSLVATLIVPALSLTFVGLVQGAAISGSVPNPDGEYPDSSGDFRGQGIANIASGVFQGMPVGGSMSATSIVTSAGAKSRLALIIAGLTMMLVILLFSDLVSLIAMPALAGLLIIVGVKTLKPEQVRMVWRTGTTQALVMIVTFVLTLLIPLQYAVLIGVFAALVLFVTRQSNQVTVDRMFVTKDGQLSEGERPETLPGGEVVALRPTGSLFFAAAPVFEAQLPEITDDSAGAVVVIVLRGKEELGSTFINVMTRYGDRLRDIGGQLMLSGVSEDVYDQLERTGVLGEIGAENVYRATNALTGDALKVMAVAQGLAGQQPEQPPADGQD